MNMEEKLNALKENKAFSAEFEKVTSAQELTALFQRYGVDVPLEIAQELFVPISNEDGELSTEDLENVAGGGIFGAIGGALGGAALGYTVGYLGGRLAGWSKKESRAYAAKCASSDAVAGAALGLAFIPG